MQATGISLGWNCYPAGWGVQNNIRQTRAQGYTTCPFDECISNYAGVVNCIEEEFEHFTDLKYIELLPAPINVGSRIRQGDVLVYNTRYNMIFNHESPGHANLHAIQRWAGGVNHYTDNNFTLFCERYNRRINNFKSYINNNDVNFIIHRLRSNMVELCSVLNDVYPNLRYSITHIPTTNVSELESHLRLMQVKEADIIKELTVGRLNTTDDVLE